MMMRSTAKDQTSEFFKLVRKHRGSSPVTAQQPQNNDKVNLDQVRSFNSKAKGINDNIVLVTARLQKLTSLVRERSLFHDPLQEINKLTLDIKQDLQRINQSIDVLGGSVGFANSSSFSQQSKQNSTQIVSDLKAKLATTSKDFACVLQQRTNALKEQHNRRGEFESSGNKGDSRLRQRNVGGVTSMRDRLHKYTHDDDDDDVEMGGLLSDNDMNQNETAETSSGISFASLVDQTQMTLVQETNKEDEYLAAKSAAIDQMRGTIEEIAGMYTRLNEIVHLQEELTIRIDMNMDDVSLNIEEGHNELIKYFDSLSSNQWLIIKIFAILIVFAIFFVTVIA